MTATPPDETPQAEPAPAPAPAPATPVVQQFSFVRSHPFQLALVGVVGLAIGGLGGLGVGLFAGHHHFGGPDRRAPHGYYQEGPRQDRQRVPLPPRPQKPGPVRPGLPKLPNQPTPAAPSATP